MTVGCYGICRYYFFYKGYQKVEKFGLSKIFIGAYHNVLQYEQAFCFRTKPQFSREKRRLESKVCLVSLEWIKSEFNPFLIWRPEWMMQRDDFWYTWLQKVNRIFCARVNHLSSPPLSLVDTDVYLCSSRYIYHTILRFASVLCRCIILVQFVSGYGKTICGSRCLPQSTCEQWQALCQIWGGAKLLFQLENFLLFSIERSCSSQHCGGQSHSLAPLKSPPLPARKKER